MFVHDSLRDNAQSTVPLRVEYEYTDLETCKHITTNLWPTVLAKTVGHK